MKDKTVLKEAEERTMNTVQNEPSYDYPHFPPGQRGSRGQKTKMQDMREDSSIPASAKGKKVWIDLDNSPHVPFFLPIIKNLEQSGCTVILTARDSYQVCELLDYYDIKALVLGKHYGKQKLFKVLGTLLRALQLFFHVRSQKPVISVSHGSRACMIASHFMGIDSFVLGDYEFTNKLKLFGPHYMVFPEIVPSESIQSPGVQVLKYPGIKEDVYVSNLRPDPGVRGRMGVTEDDLLITVRPPATEAHYHNPESDTLLIEALRKFSGQPGVKILLLPRNKRQESELKDAWAEQIRLGHILVPSHVEDGLNIIWNSDLVISGGGTMNREAAALGVPVYSIFRGKTGAVDRYLSEKGRLIMLESVDDIHTKLVLARRNTHPDLLKEDRPALKTIMGYITAILASEDPSRVSANTKVVHGP